MRAFGCSAKSRKVIEVGSPDELPKMTIVPLASMRAIAAASEAPPADFEDQREAALRLIDAFDDLGGTAQMAAALRRRQRWR